MLKFGELKGVYLILFFIVASAAQGVYLSGMLQHADIYSVIIVIFLVLTILFGFLTWMRSSEFVWSRSVAINLFLINLTTLGNWFGFMWAIKYIEPAIASALLNSVGPVIILMLNASVLKKGPVKLQEAIASIGVLIAMIMSGAVILTGHSAVGDMDHERLYVGIAMSVLCGLSVSLNTVISKGLTNERVQPHQIMAFRFFVLIVASLMMTTGSSISSTVADYYVPLAFVTVLGYLIPMYALQVGLKLVEPLTASFSMALAPLVFIVIQMFDARLQFSWFSLITILTAMVFIVYGVYVKHLASKVAPF
ncbi:MULTISPECIES: EamA family transporter [unclassified Pseudomonas]|uniref:EamA family transporter n=1 Tax=unclassified Pseudomonas TaxID=196821 RepID=UPI000871335C|nr:MULTISPECIES: EamA family transporter [unclassified Pseudomonas]SCW96203.1 EamA-like transporter family protein [Pseudomonas sp. NFACC56-3]SFL06544.1 EamA-like transporter family protein [Pseudomonas sp. NFACC52]